MVSALLKLRNLDLGTTTPWAPPRSMTNPVAKDVAASMALACSRQTEL